MKQQLFLVIGLTVLLSNLCIVASAQSDDVEWLDAQEYTLYWGDEVNHSGYHIMAEDFSPAKPIDVDTDYVMLTINSIYDDAWGAILGVNNTQISNNTAFDNRLNITAIEVVTGNDISSPYTVLSVAVSNSTGSLPVKVSWMDASFEFKEHYSDEVYIDERAYFSLEMKNIREIPFDDVTVEVVLPDNLVMDPDSDTTWNYSFSPYQKKILDYSLKGLRPGSYDLNGTSINVNYEGKCYSREMNASTLVIHGPLINVSKSVYPESAILHDEINISIDVVNEGDRAAHITVSDQLPAGARILSGVTGGSLVLHPDDIFMLDYTVSMDKTGEIAIPSAKVRFVDSNEYSGNVYSKKIPFKVFDPNDAASASAINEDIEDESVYHEETFESDESSQQSIQDPAESEDEEDHGKLQILYDLLDKITEFLKNTKEKIL